MTRDLLINAIPGETRAALVEDGKLSEFRVMRRGMGPHRGDILLGRIEKVLPNLSAAFVDIGAARSGFLALRAGAKYTEGEAVVVQVTKEAVADKGPAVSTVISLGSGLVAFLPFGEGVKVSRRITNEAERNRLIAAAEGLIQGEGGLILRTAAQGAERSMLEGALSALQSTWTKLSNGIASGEISAPAYLFGSEDGLSAVLRDYGGLADKIHIDLMSAVLAARKLVDGPLPELAGKLTHHREGAVFDLFDVAEEIDGLASRVVALPSGGSLIIDEAEAMTVIDVNTARHAARRQAGEIHLAVNLEAADEIARQVRLRNLSGLIIVDLIRMEENADRRRVVDAFGAAFASDPAGAQIHGLTRTGLLEITRSRSHTPLSHVMFGPCPLCRGGGRIKAPLSLAYEALRGLLHEGRLRPAGTVSLTAASDVINRLEGVARDDLKAVEELIGRNVELRAAADFAPERLEISILEG